MGCPSAGSSSAWWAQTGPWPAVLAGRLVAGVRVAAAAAVAPAVDGPERGGGEGGEHQRVLGHRLGHGLAAGDAGPDQLEHVRGVQARAGRALAGAAVAAAHMGDPEWLLLAAVGRHDLPGGGVDRLGAAAQPDRLGAVPDPDQGLGPGVEPRETSRSPTCCWVRGGDRREVEGCRVDRTREHLREDVGQRRGDVRTGPRAHRPHHPKGCATRLSAIPPRDTPGSGGPRSPTGGAMSRRGIACSRDTTNQGVRGRSRQFVSCLRRCVSGLWPWWGADPRGNAPSVQFGQVMSGLELSSPTSMTPTTDNCGRHADKPCAGTSGYADERTSWSAHRA